MSNILHRADQIVNHRSEEKERQYGPFSECMDRATAIYNAMSPEDERISSLGLYRALVALKLSREAYAHKEDNLLDAVAYLGAMNHELEDSWPDFEQNIHPHETEVAVIDWSRIEGSKQEYFDKILARAQKTLETKGIPTKCFISIYFMPDSLLAFETYIDKDDNNEATLQTWFNKELLDTLNITYHEIQ